MICAWDSLLGILPLWMRNYVDKVGRESLLELRLRINSPPELVGNKGLAWMNREVSQEDISFCINTASRYSPWAASTISSGYICVTGGHRIGICGEVVIRDDKITSIKNIHSICIRVARDYPGISCHINKNAKSILIIGAPGWGKTTLLRDLVRVIGKDETVSVVDERGELFPDGMSSGKRVDVLSCCSKSDGISMVLRAMGPDRIAVDEITADVDVHAVIHANGCGVGILATAHASSIENMLKRPLYRSILDNKIFDSIVVLHSDKSYHQEWTNK